jgi:drug/metabolite transporter (DMT)-like permease
VLSVSWAAIFIKLAAAPPLTAAAWRLTFASVPLAAWVRVRHWKELQGLERGQWLLLLGSGVALAFHFGTWVCSLDFTSVASSVALVTTTPIWVSLYERPPRRTLFGMAVAMAGTLVIAGTDYALDARALWGDALALAGALCGAAYLTLGKKVRAKLGVAQYVGVVYPVAALCAVFGALFSHSPLTGLTQQQWLYLVLLAAVPQLLGHSLLNWALEHVSAALVAIAILGEPIFSTLLAIPILHQVPGPSRVLGAAVVLCGVGLAAWSEGRRRPVTETL